MIIVMTHAATEADITNSMRVNFFVIFPPATLGTLALAVSTIALIGSLRWLLGGTVDASELTLPRRKA
jgi:hypothetical protein